MELLKLPVTSCRKYRKKRSFESPSVCVCEPACIVAVGEKKESKVEI